MFRLKKEYKGKSIATTIRGGLLVDHSFVTNGSNVDFILAHQKKLSKYVDGFDSIDEAEVGDVVEDDNLGEGTVVDLESLKMPELRELAEAEGIETKGLKKAELIEKLK